MIALAIVGMASSTTVATGVAHGAPPDDPEPSKAAKLRIDYLRMNEEGKYAAAVPLAEQACVILERELGRTSRELGACLSDLAMLHTKRGEYVEARSLLERSLSIKDAMLGSEHLEVAISLSALADVHMKQGEYAEAGPLLERALAIREKTLGPEHPDLATALNNMAVLYWTRGDYEKAEASFVRALSIIEAARGHEHPLVAASLNNLAALYQAQGEYEKARQTLERALSIRESVLGLEHPDVAASLNNLGVLELKRGEPGKAVALHERAVAIFEKALGPEHPDLATSLNNLAAAHRERGDHEQAMALQERALSIRERVLGPAHPDVAVSLRNLAALYEGQGEHEAAEALLGRALSIREQALGPEHPSVAISLNDLGLVELALGRHADALELHRRALAIEEKNLTRALTFAEESRRVAYAGTLFASTHRVVSLHLQDAPQSHASAELALTTLLRRKGRVQELVAQSNAALRHSLPEAHRHLLEDIAGSRAQYAAIAHRVPGELSPADRSKELGRLEERQDQLWALLAAHSRSIAAFSKPIGIDDIQAVLPHDGALVELAHYFPRLGDGDHAPSPRYAAYLVFPDHIDWVDLGPASNIDAQVLDFRTRLLHEQSIPRDLYDTVMAPVVERLGSTRELFIAPDGELNRIPFAALHDGDAYLVERYTLRFVTTGRDLLRPRSTSNAERHEVLVVANPTGADLPGTEREAELVAGLFPHARTLVRDEATETRVMQRTRPRLLHIGTHGFYDRSKPERALETVATERMRWSEPLSLGLVDNPMLASGLVLATPDPEHTTRADDGRLTAYEVSGWDLQGTELVVLSACGTGLGTVKTGEGVMGLRRAFAMAGAQTQVMSLWDLGDETTPAVMELYYRKLAAGVGRGDAMQQAQLELMHGDHPHPLHWAAFVVVGEWAPLSWVEPAVETPPPVEPPRGCQASVGATGDASGLAVLGLLGFVARRRRRRLRNILGPTLLASACASSPQGSDLDSPASLTSLSWADARTVSGWVRGEPRRPIPVDARGASLGLQKVMLDDPASRTVEPGSCGMGLRSLLSIPGQPGAVLVSNASGELFRYESGARHRMTTRVALPPIGELLGLEAEASPLHLLVSDREGEQLWELELGDAEVLSATFLGEGVPFADRVAFLDRYWVGRCLHGARGCLALVYDDVQLSLDRRDHPEVEPEIVMPLGQALVTDVGYADASGTSVYLLTAQVCEDVAAKSRRGSGVVEPQAPQ